MQACTHRAEASVGGIEAKRGGGGSRGVDVTDVSQDVTVLNAEGYSLLHVAAEKGIERIVQTLITHGVALSERHADGYTPLRRAVLGSHTDTVKALLN